MSKVNFADIPLEDNDADAGTIGEYLESLLVTIISEGEGFSGKRPFGNSGWEWTMHNGLFKAGLLKGTADEEGNLDEYDSVVADQILIREIRKMFKKEKK